MTPGRLRQAVCLLGARLLRTAVLLASLAACGVPEEHPQPDDYGLECDPTLEEQCSSGMDCVPLGQHNDPYEDVPDDLYTCAMPCESDLDCPDNHCDLDINPAYGTERYPCAEDGYCIVAWCTSNGPYR